MHDIITYPVTVTDYDKLGFYPYRISQLFWTSSKNGDLGKKKTACNSAFSSGCGCLPILLKLVNVHKAQPHNKGFEIFFVTFPISR